MKVWTAIAMFSLLLGCGDSKIVSDAGRDSATTQRPTPAEDDIDSGDGWTGPCDRAREVHVFKIDGGTWTVTVPNLCDPTPYIEKGDPAWQTLESNAK